jgi:uncharacterized membrane protein YgaE (UPF0421/DUF939 family)
VAEVIKKLIFPVLFAIIAFFTAPLLGPEINGATTFFLVAVGIGLGVMLDIFLFKKNNNNTNVKDENKSN